MRPNSFAKVCVALALASALTAGTAGTASAQSSKPTIKAFLGQLFANVPTPAEEAAGLVNKVTENGQRFTTEISKLVNLGIINFPNTSSSAGFGYLVNPTTGEIVPKTESFGPLFMERALTNGKGVMNFGVSYQHSTFDHLLGQNMKTDGIFVFNNEGIWPDGFKQFLKESALLDIKVDAMVFSYSIGVSNNVDVGFAVPVSFVEVTGGRLQSWDLTRNFATDPATRAEFPTAVGTRQRNPGQTTLNASGIGDVAVRTKIAFGSQTSGAAAVVGELRLPTGDEEQLLGAGKAGGTLSLHASHRAGGVNLYGTGGYRFGGLAKTFEYSGAVDTAFGPSKQVTAAVAILGTTILDGVALSTVRTFDRVGTTGIRTTFDRNILGDATLPTLNLVPSIRVRVGHGFLFSGALAIPLTDKAISGGISPVVGFDYTFSKQ
ncbi:MAG: hypothetical protein U0Q12_04700 [Vicinamibacterales bacterium]